METSNIVGYQVRRSSFLIFILLLLFHTVIIASQPEYKISTNKELVVVNDYAVMKSKNTIQLPILNNDRLPANYNIKVTKYTSNTNWLDAPTIVGGDQLKFHQPQNNGTDTVRYEVCQSGGECLEATAVFTVVDQKDQPNAARDIAITDKEKEVEVDVFANDYGNNSVSVTVKANPKNGTYAVNGKKIKYWPNDGYVGPDSLTYEICDGNCSQNRLVIYVLGNNQPPVLSNISLNTKEDESYNFGVSDFKDKFTDPTSKSLNKVKIISLPVNGTLMVDGSNAIVNQEVSASFLDKLKYTPNLNFNGSDSWQWNASNGVLYASNTASVNISIDAVNDPPDGNDDTGITLMSGEDKTIDALANDSDPEGDDLNITGTSSINSSKGNIQIVSNKLKFTANKSFIGDIEIIYDVSDGNGGISSAKVFITVIENTNPPTIENISITMDEDEVKTFSADIFTDKYTDDIDRVLSKIKIEELPKQGDLKLAGSAVTLNQEIAVADINDLTYEPKGDYFGNDEFTYNANNGIQYASNNKKVLIQIDNVNDAPVAVADLGLETDEDVNLIIDVLANDQDIDGDALSIVSIQDNDAVGEFEIESGKILYKPKKNYFGDFDVNYIITDGNLNDENKISIKVNSINDKPVITSFNEQINENSAIDFSNSKFESNFDDVDGQTVQKIKIIQLPAHGKLQINNQTLSINQKINKNQFGVLKYVPDHGFFGKDSIQWNASDGTIYADKPAWVRITVVDINFAPVANEDNNISTQEDTPVIIDVLANDTDEDGDRLIISKLSSVNNASIEITADEKIRLIPDIDYTGKITFSYEITDAGNETAEAEVNVIVIDVNDPPIITSSSIVIKQNETFTFDFQFFLGKYEDIEDDQLRTFFIKKLPVNGQLTINGEAVNTGEAISPFSLAGLVYTPFSNFIGDDSFLWNVSDGQDQADNDAAVDLSIRRFEGQVHAFKAISPNGDGRNDEWFIEGIEMYPVNNLRLFDRDGQLIISIDNYDNQQNIWKGEKGRLGATGNLVEDGTYYYVLELADQFTEKGYVIVQK